jgi:hypothetical protein
MKGSIQDDEFKIPDGCEPRRVKGSGIGREVEAALGGAF